MMSAIISFLVLFLITAGLLYIPVIIFRRKFFSKLAQVPQLSGVCRVGWSTCRAFLASEIYECSYEGRKIYLGESRLLTKSTGFAAFSMHMPCIIAENSLTIRVSEYEMFLAPHLSELRKDTVQKITGVEEIDRAFRCPEAAEDRTRNVLEHSNTLEVLRRLSASKNQGLYFVSLHSPRSSIANHPFVDREGITIGFHGFLYSLSKSQILEVVKCLNMLRLAVEDVTA